MHFQLLTEIGVKVGITLAQNSARIKMHIHITELVLHKCMLTAQAVVSKPALFCLLRHKLSFTC